MAYDTSTIPQGYGSLPIQTRTGNPYLDEIDQAAGNAHASLSPGAQEALKRAGAPVGIQAQQQPQESPVIGPRPRIGGPRPPVPSLAPPMSENMPNGQPAMTAAIGTPRPSVQPVPVSAQEQAQTGELNRITAPDTGFHNRQNTGVSGREQIHNPWARNALGILEAIGTGFAPGLTSAIPGTQLHHNVLVNQAEGGIAEQEKIRAAQEKAQKEASEEELQGSQGSHFDAETNTLIPAQATEANARAWSLLNPQDKEKELTEFALWHKQNPDAPVSEWIKLKAGEQKLPEGERPLGERVDQVNQMLTTRYQVLHPKAPLPAQYTVPPNATQKDYDRIDKGLEAEERAIGTKEQQAQTNQMRAQTLALAQANAQNRQDTAIRTAGFKAYTPALESAERFNVMARNYEDAVKNHDQQAMLSLLANHLGMTMGLQKGSRLTKDIIHEAETSRPWLQGLQAKFDSNGYLSGVNLTPAQMQQMVNLGRERFTEDATRARSEAAYQGVQDQGPARVPNRSTINHYTALAGGDPKKAKELAAADGWTVQ